MNYFYPFSLNDFFIFLNTCDDGCAPKYYEKINEI